MDQRLTINLDICRDCVDCTAACSYPYHPVNDGVARLREHAAQEVVCRRCELRSCVLACPREALVAGPDGVLHRHNMRCTGCLSCSQACPFGVLVPAALQFHDSMCDFCAGRAGAQPPACVQTCPRQAITLEVVTQDAPETYPVGRNLAVRAALWRKTEAPETP